MFKKVLITLLILAAFPLWAAPPLHHASGGGFFVLHSGSGDYDVMFAFNARQLSEDGSAQGQFEQHNLSNGGIVHLEIVNMELFDGNNVCLIGLVTKSINTNAGIGDDRAVWLRDNGEGEGKNAGLDERSKLVKNGIDCVPSNFVLLDLDGGNIKIR